MIKNISLGIIFLPLVSSLFGQNLQARSDFKPSGKPFERIYTDFHRNFYEGKQRHLFDATRSYMGYEHSFSKYFSEEVNLEVGNPGGGKLQMAVYLRNASVQHKKDGREIIAGVDVSTEKGIKTSPDYQFWKSQNRDRPAAFGAYLSL